MAYLHARVYRILPFLFGFLALTLVGCIPVVRAATDHLASQEVQQTTVEAPTITHGPVSGEVSGEVSATSAVLWARGNQIGSLQFAIADNAAFATTVVTVTATL